MSGRARLATGLLLVAAAVVVVVLTTGGSDGYVLRAQLRDVAGLRNGANVRLDGAPVGRVSDITLHRDGIVDVRLQLKPSVAPVGRGARAVVQGDDLFGERYVDLDRGDLRHPVPSGTTIPPSRTGVSVRLDDVVDMLNLPTRAALELFLREQGAAVVGRGRDLAQTLEELPASLSDTQQLVSQFGQDTAAIGRLVEESDRVVGSVAARRADMGRLVTAADGALTALAERRRELAQTVQEAPGTLQAARSTLAALRAAARPLAPAADGLRSTAPLLTRTLEAVPGFTRAAVPALQTVQRVAPSLTRLGDEGAPVARDLEPLGAALSRYAQTSDAATRTLDEGADDLFGMMEGWARATQPQDGASHLFRFGETFGTDVMLAALGHPPSGAAKQDKTPAAKAPDASRPSAAVPATPKLPTVPLPGGQKLDPNPTVDKAAQSVKGLLDYLLGK